MRAIRAAALLALLAAAGCAEGRAPLILATTTSVENSGLLAALKPHDDGYEVRSLLVGSGRALDMLAAGRADVAITHAPAREKAALQQHPGWWYRKILYNDFVLLGPPEDPARVTGADNLLDALRRIAHSDVRFLSRGDESGTHERERELWERAGARPQGDRLVIAGAGMGQTLRTAAMTGSYTLSDRATFEALRPSLALRVVFEGHPALLNTYAVVAPESNVEGMRFARWLAEGGGRARLMASSVEGVVRGFRVWPEGMAGQDPLDQPTGPLPVRPVR